LRKDKSQPKLNFLKKVFSRIRDFHKSTPAREGKPAPSQDANQICTTRKLN